MKTRRLFFALWPPVQVRQSIVKTFSQFPQNFKGRIVQPHNLHVTLHFIGSVSDEIKDCMHTSAQNIKADSFAYALDCFGSFKQAKILWMGHQHLPDALEQLHQKLAVALQECGYQSEQRVYTPHVTLMRKCTHTIDAQPDFSIPWFVDEFVLVESSTDQYGVNYQVIEKYPLS